MNGRISLLALVLVLTACAGITVAQRTTRTPRQTPRPTPTPVPVQVTTDQILGQEPGRPLVDPQDVEQTPPANSPEQSQQTTAPSTEALLARIKALESSRSDKYDEQQKRLLMNLDILTRAEQRSENLRKQVFELMEKEAAVQTKLDQLAYEMRPEMINRVTTQMGGSMKPEEVREEKARTLAAEQTRQQNLLAEIQSAKARVEAGLERSEQLVERLRSKIEKDIDDSLDPETPTRPQ